MERFNLTVFRRFWTMARPYWFGDEKWNARGLLLLTVVLLLGYTGLSVVLNNKRGVLISALSAQDEVRFWQTVGVFLAVLVAYAPLLAAYNYLQKRLGLEWRRWLTTSLVGRYFSERAYYRLHQIEADIDNPDQRMAEDAKNFTQESLALVLVLAGSVLQVVAFSSVLWGISPLLVGFLALYAILGTLVTVGVFGRPLVRLNFEQLKREADFRFGLVRIRENVEAIAFYRGETQEADQVQTRFMAAFDNFKRLIRWELGLNALTNVYEFVPFVLPAIVVAPAVFGGDLEVGKVSEAQGAFLRVFFSLNVVVDRFQTLTAFGAGIDRLADFTNALAPAADPGSTAETETITETVVTETGVTETAAPDGTTLAEPVAADSIPDDAAPDVPAVAETAIETAGTDDLAADAPVPHSGASPASPVAVTAQPAQIHTETADQVALHALTLQTPDHRRTLVEKVTLELAPGQGLLLMGPSGCGKSSLLRAIAGLWTAGEGTILRPNLDDILFLPQKPYMILGSLREQLRYPHAPETVDDAQLLAALEKVNLPDLAERMGGLDTVADWGDVLSLGEQQRLTFARLVIQRPAYAMLDEATSALDLANEAQLYGHLQALGTTFISVGHRDSLRTYHHQTLTLLSDQRWQIGPSLAGASA